MVPITAVLEWKDIGSLGGTGKERIFPSILVTSGVCGVLPGMDEEPAESLWVRIKGRVRSGDVIVVVCCRPPDQEEHADEFLYRQTGRQEQSHVHKPWLLQGTSTTPVSVGREIRA